MGSGGVVSLFFQDRFYLLTASEFLKTYAEIEGLDPEAFHSRVLGWLAEPEVRGENQERKQGEGDFRRDLPTIRK